VNLRGDAAVAWNYVRRITRVSGRGVFLVLSGLVTSLKITDKIEIFAVAIIFGYAQYLFTRLIDQKANEVLKSASSRNDPSAAPQVPAGSGELSLATTSAPSRPQVTGISPAKTSRANKCAGPGRGSKERPK
jgi:hypothetical protein